MNRSTFALFVAVLIHLLLFLLLWILFHYAATDINKQLEHQEKKIKISLKEMPVKHKKSGLTKKKIPQPKIAPPMPKGSQLKKIVKPTKPIKYEPKKPVKKPKLNKPKKAAKKTPPKPKIEPLPPKKPYIPLLAAKKETNTTKELKKKPKKEKALAWLYEDVADKETKTKKKTHTNSSSISQDIKELYGEEFGKLTPGQQQYILDNQEIMRRITQQVLIRVARVNIPRDLNVNRHNIIEFKLHPNGDMTDFKFLSKSGYYILDDTTKETIEYAYSRYPRPKETTLIRYNVFYNLARY
ncbi:energy transducer TonB family protein [Sulfurimonas paralvinellae]|uniref:Energy transducer TonB n=1 Tax=Sulfurimonas paralvinellae TaxID=317658 RepID=A0A7M1B9W1_9BACT|nr:energy transducer TonB [Sulfurimonas paralvinellae]QOP45628.1 energy transducer TonB [Sulfurimonas paralvinellae]